MQTGEIILLVGVIGTIAGATAAGYRRSRRIPEPAGAEPERDAPDRVEGSGSAAPDINELLRRTLRRDLSLAAEHVHSIHSLLEIARQHQQPIPSAALTNLDLVSKHLAEIERRIEAANARFRFSRQRVRTSSGESSSSSSSAAFFRMPCFSIR